MKTTKLTEELQGKVDNMSNFQKKFCEYRSKGMKQGEAAKFAGSEASGASLNRVGYNTEQMDGVKEYIEHLQDERSLIGIIDDIEIAGKLRDIYEKALLAKKYSDANKSVELMGTMIGLFGSSKKSLPVERAPTKSNIKNDVSAFQDEDDETTTTASKISSVEKLIKNLKD